ncbi:MAG TPA: extracellular solute-binding protein [Aggregatilineales bacterium]|nr:extracellular solute-binding protein [Aggregatilineales bacterium]
MALKRLSNRLTKIATLVTAAVLLAACGSTGGGNSGRTGLSGGNDTPQPAPNALHIKFIYGSEKQAWVEAVTQTFNAANNTIKSGKQIYVDTEAIGSGESVSNMVEQVAGHNQPTLWSPASSVWIPILNDRWTTKNGASLISGDCPKAVISPVVIMMWKPEAQALGWPDKEIGWADIAKIATDPKGWADYGNPQWGAFRFGHTHPDYSNSGLLSILAEAYAATGKLGKLTVDDINQPSTADFVKNVESSIAHYGSSTGFFGNAMITRGPSYLSAAVVYESVVVSSYDPKNNPAFPLVAIYPKEGTFLSDHPLCIPDGSWISADQREAAQIYRDYLLSKPVQQQALQFGFRPSDTSISIGAPIDAAHGVDPTKPQNVFTTPDINVLNAARTLWGQQKKKVNLTLLIDISGSMGQENKMDGVHTGASAFIDQLDDSDTLSLIAFDDKEYPLFTNVVVGQNRQQIKDKIASLQPQDGTALYDAIAYSISNMKIDPTRINGLVVLTDGNDTSSTQYIGSDHSDPSKLLTLITGGNTETASGSPVTIFTIGYGSDADNNVLQQVAQAGRGDYRKSAGANDIRQIYLDLSTFF